MTLAEIVYSLAALASGLAAVLAWVAKIRWAKEYREAKEAQVETLKTQIEGLQRLSPPVLFDWLENIQKVGQKQIEILEKQLADKDSEIEKLQGEQLEKARRERDQMKALESTLNKLKEEAEEKIRKLRREIEE